MPRQAYEVHEEGDLGAVNDAGLVIREASVDGQGGEIRDKPVFTIDEAAWYLNRGIGQVELEDGTIVNSGAHWAGAVGDHNNLYYGGAVSKVDNDGVLNTLSFGFYETRADILPVYQYFGGNAPGVRRLDGFSAFDAEQREAARQSIDAWDELISVDFIETTAANADINFMNTTTGPIQASAYLPYDYGAFYEGIQGDVAVNPNQASNHQFDEGQYGINTLVHELGHSLGLEHPGNYNFGPNFEATYDNGAEYYQDSRQYSIMSYWDAEETGANHVDWTYMTYSYGSTPGIHDVAAIQRIYGADTTTRTGNDTYGFNTSLSTTGLGDDNFDFEATPAPVITIWDAGGVDTLDLSGYDTSSIIDLRPGQFSSAGGFYSEEIPTLAEINARRAEAGLTPRTQGQYDLYMELFEASYDNGLMSDNIGIAYGAVIENAVGGSGDDVIIGNTVNNNLTGGAGDDTFVFLDDDSKDKIRDFDSGSDQIDLSAFGLTSGDLKITGGNVFANTDGVKGYELHIVVQGEKVQIADIAFGDPTLEQLTASTNGTHQYA